jgi:hypothetical protein
MRAAMKLDRSWCAFAVLVVSATGCGTRVSATPVSAARTPVSTVRLMAAELRATDDAPKVGKSQRSDSSVVDDEEGKRESHGRLDRKRGGFSGYK